MSITTITKRPLTVEQAYQILESTHIISVLAEMIKVEHQIKIFDTKFKLPNTNNLANRIIEAANQIQRNTAIQFKLKDREKLTYNDAVQLHRLLTHFIEIGIERTEEFMDGVDALKAAGEAVIKAEQEKDLLSEYSGKIPMEDFMLNEYKSI